MEKIKKVILPILIIGIWINISETLRWLLIVEKYWIDHYQNLNLVFPTGPLTGIIWMTWGFGFATVIFLLSKKFPVIQTTFLSWFAVFALMWIVLWAIEILPLQILWIVLPLSLFEAFVGSLICKKITN